MGGALFPKDLMGQQDFKALHAHFDAIKKEISDYIK
jgi:hypothetical protein